MANFTAKGLDEYINSLKALEDVEPVINRAVFGGAKIVADEITAEIREIPVVKDNLFGSKDHPLNGITEDQKNGLLNGFGISHIQNDDGRTFVKIGFAGYNDTKTVKYPSGQPNAMIARSVVSGTSFRKKNNFIQKALSKAKDQAQAEIEQTFQNELEKLQK